MNEIILIGTGGHARSCIDVIEHGGLYNISGLISENAKCEDDIFGYPILGTDDNLSEFRKKYKFAFIGIGQIKTAKIRVRLFELLNKLGYILPTIVSPRAHVSKHAKIGDGTIVMHDAVVNANARIGKNCIINNKALVEHDVIIGDHCHIATGAIVNGEVKAGNEIFFGSGVVIKQSVSIGDRCVIGLGIVIKKDLNPNQVIKN